MDRILIILKKENGPRASSVPALGLNTIIFKHVYWYMQRISGERLQDHWFSGSLEESRNTTFNMKPFPRLLVQLLFAVLSIMVSHEPVCHALLVLTKLSE